MGQAASGRQVHMKACDHSVVGTCRDIKPANIFLCANDLLKIGDLGVAKALTHINFARTQIGTPSYMAPVSSHSMLSLLSCGYAVEHLHARQGVVVHFVGAQLCLQHLPWLSCGPAEYLAPGHGLEWRPALATSTGVLLVVG